MKKTSRSLFKLMCATVVPTVLVSSFYVNAEPGILQNVPFSAVSTDVQANVLFILDDSGSMNFEIIRRDGQDDDYRIDVTPTFDTDLTAPLNPGTDVRELLGACVGFNTIYYDPTEVYEPWAGVDENGDDFVGQEATTARVNPYSASDATPVGGAQVPIDAVGIVNLVTISDGNNNAGYIPWQDDGDGIFEDGECVTDPTAANFSFVTVASLADANDPTTPAGTINTRQNFANWFTYHRSRSFIAKSALLSVIEQNRQRVGVVGLISNVADGILIRDVDNIRLSDGSEADNTRLMNAITNKAALMDSVASSRSGGGTPLAATLLLAGRYFSETVPIPDDFFDGTDTPTPSYNTGTDGTITANSPILSNANGGTCQANYSILFTDGFANGSGGVTVDVGNADGDGNTPLLDGGSFADTFPNTLADVAMFYLENDIAPGLVDEAGIRDQRRIDSRINRQHMSTYTVGLGVNGTLDANPSDVDAAFTWPEPQDLNSTSIDDLRHAAWNGRGRFFASTGPTLSDDIEGIFSEIDEINSTTTAASSVSSGFIQQDSLVFQAQFNPSDFSGNVFAFSFTPDGLVDLTTNSGNGIFNVLGVLNSQVLSDNGIAGTVNAPGYTSTRNIITKQINITDIDANTNTATTLQTGSGISFAFDQLSLSQQQVFTQERLSFDGWDATDDTDFGVALVNYIKGDSTNEQNNSTNNALNSGEDGGESAFRSRSRQYLGAVVNSSPQFVGVPNELYPDQIEGSGPTELYSSFQAAQANRTPIIYVGANDGMLHAFDTSVNAATLDAAGNIVAPPTVIPGVSGREVFAYIPALLTRDLPQIAQPSFVFDSFVDSTPTIRDVYVNTAGTDQWRTYLVSGLRNGGRGIFALDVTDPASTFSNSLGANARADDVVKFEYTHPDLGFTYSRIQIARMNNGSWVAVVGNGYNSVGDGRGKLFIIDLETGLPLAGAGPTGSNGIFDTGVGSIMNSLCTDAGSDCNGLSEPTIVDLNGDFITDRIYAGDLHGNIWVFNVQDPDPSQWTIARLFTAAQSNCTVGTGEDCRQPITTRPVVSLHPSRRSLTTEPNVLVLFGTGQFIAEGDASNAEDQTFYGVWDTTGTSGTINNSNLTKADLVGRVFGGTLDNITVTGPVAGYNTAASPSPARNFGWYIDLAGDIAPAGLPGGLISDPFDRGRISINPIITGSVALFVTTVPSGEVVCEPGQIPGFLTALDVESGLSPGFDVFVDENGNPIDTSTIALSNGAVGLDLDTTGTGKQTRITNIDGSIDQEQISDSQDIPSGRKAWSILR